MSGGKHSINGSAGRPGTDIPTDRVKLEVAAVSRTFRHGKRTVNALAAASLTVEPGEFVSIIGPSGCGKSTLFNIIAGLDAPDAGRVVIDGSDVTGRTESCAYMPQRDLLFPWRTVLDNTILGLEVQGMPRDAAREQAAPLFKTFGIDGYESSYPFQLSGGMRQRAALLRTVVQGRSVLLLDEPFGALDSLTRTEMQGWLASVWEEYHWTVLLVTHDIQEAVLLSDRVYVMTGAPGTVRTVVGVDLERPRTLETLSQAEFARCEGLVVEALHGDRTGPRAGP